MSVHLQREIGRVKQSILALCAIVEDQVQMAVRALLERDVILPAPSKSATTISTIGRSR